MFFHLIKYSFYPLFIVLNILLFSSNSYSQEINNNQVKKPIDLDTFKQEYNQQNQESFLEQLTIDQANNNPNNFFLTQSDENNQEDFGEPVNDSLLFWSVLFEQLEFQTNENENIFNWDLNGWVGGDYRKFRVKSEGDINLDENEGEAEFQFLYSKQISPFFDLQAGLRYDQLFGSETGKVRGHAVIGVEGLAPYFFEVGGALFVSQKGDISARFEAEYEFLLSQKIILQPSIETNLAIQKVEEFGVGSGINDVELGLRLRYEIGREFAPYIGVSWGRLLGETANLAKEEGESIDDLKFVAGVRLFF